MILTCGCGLINRIPSLPKARIRCGNCHREFSPADLVHAKLEAPPVREEIVVDDDELAKAYERDKALGTRECDDLLKTFFGAVTRMIRRAILRVDTESSVWHN